MVLWLAPSLASWSEEARGVRAAHTLAEAPAISILAIAGLLSTLALGREAAKPANASLTGAQRIAGARVYVQAAVVLTTVSIMGLVEAVELSRWLRRPP